MYIGMSMIGFMCGMAYMVWLVNLNGFILDLPGLLIIGVLIGLFSMLAGMIMVKLEV
ncbi:hypothetical protein IKJ53_05510 [bacterium]|nr:hypothetical protein [bacterium]